MNTENYSTGGNQDQGPKKKQGKGVSRWAKVVCTGLVFGVVASAAFQTSNIVAGKVLGTTQTTNKTAKTTTTANSAKLTTSSNSSSGTANVTEVAKNAMPSIVSITNMSVQEVQNFFGGTQKQKSESAGSGIIVGQNDSELLIVTNNHVVEGSSTLTVTFIDEESVEADIKGTDSDKDLAVVAVPLSKIKDSTMNKIAVATLGDSDKTQVGDQVIAIGNALGYGQSVTVGYISALNREISASDETVKVLQTDAAINPGNSGGALVNMQGELIGINTAKYSDTSVEGMGYALPISDVQELINDLIAGKDVSNDGTTSGQAYLGISAQTITKQYSQLLNMPEGVYISSVEQGSAAEECGLQSGDIICSLDGEDIADMETFHDKIVACNPGDKVTIVYYRNNNGNYEKQTATATLKAKQ